MKGGLYQVLALAAIIAITADVGLCSLIECEKATCPDGPVLVQFQYENCTGTQKFYSVVKPFNTCKNTTGIDDPSPTSKFYTFNDIYYAIETYSSDNCGAGEALPSYSGRRIYFGNCDRTDGLASNNRFPSSGEIVSGAKRDINYLGEMYLKNANQSFESPQNRVVLLNVPEDPSETVSCNSLDDCQSKGFYYDVEYNNTCTVDAWTTYTVQVNITANTCYQLPYVDQYISYRCTNLHTAEALFSVNADCSRPYMSWIARSTCSDSNRKTTYCTAVTPNPNPTPSSASSTQLSIFGLIVGLLFLIVL